MDPASQLLRMLEPALRPGNLPGPQTAGATPIEARSFDSVLSEAQQQAGQLPDLDTIRQALAVRRDAGAGGAAAGGTTVNTASAPDAATLPAASRGGCQGLAGLDQIENASLRQVLAQHSSRGENGGVTSAI